MKFALLFLSALLVVSHQQFQQYRDGLDWWSPYYQQSYLGNYQQSVPFIGSYQQPQPFIRNYQERDPLINSYPPFYYSNNDNPFYHRRNRPNVTPASFFQVRHNFFLYNFPLNVCFVPLEWWHWSERNGNTRWWDGKWISRHSIKDQRIRPLSTLFR